MSRLAALCLSLLAAGCAYYNGMWSAQHFAKQARTLEAAGRVEEARAAWARAAVKAESVAVRHPKSRWANDALVLRGEGLARSGACGPAALPLRRAVQATADRALRERAGLALAECALEAGNVTAVDSALAGVAQSPDAGRRSRAAYLAGRAALARGDVAGATDWLARSNEPAAGPARTGAFLAAGRIAEAVALMDTLGGRRFLEDYWAAMLDALARAAGPDTAARALDRLLARRRLPVGPRARLLLADGDRRAARGEVDAAAARYAVVAQQARDSTAGQQARVRAARLTTARAETSDELAAAERRLLALVDEGLTGPAAAEARAAATLVRRVLVVDTAEPAAMFRAAELARDSLGARRLAGLLFLRLVRLRPASLFAPKALVAAAALLPERHDSLVAVLDSAYAGSPYTLAFRGAASPAFGAAEDSLARALGMVLRSAAGLSAAQLGLPVPGPRGPALDEGIETEGAARPADAAGRRDPRRARQPPPPPPPRPGERPVIPP